MSGFLLSLQEEISAKPCAVAGQNILKISLLFIAMAMLLEVLIENLALGAIKLINLPLKKEVSYHSNQTSEFNLPPNASDKRFGFLKV